VKVQAGKTSFTTETQSHRENIARGGGRLIVTGRQNLKAQRAQRESAENAEKFRV